MNGVQNALNTRLALYCYRHYFEIINDKITLRMTYDFYNEDAMNISRIMAGEEKDRFRVYDPEGSVQLKL